MVEKFVYDESTSPPEKNSAGQVNPLTWIAYAPVAQIRAWRNDEGVAVELGTLKVPPGEYAVFIPGPNKLEVWGAEDLKHYLPIS